MPDDNSAIEQAEVDSRARHRVVTRRLTILTVMGLLLLAEAVYLVFRSL